MDALKGHSTGSSPNQPTEDEDLNYPIQRIRDYYHEMMEIAQDGKVTLDLVPLILDMICLVFLFFKTDIYAVFGPYGAQVIREYDLFAPRMKPYKQTPGQVIPIRQPAQ